MSFVEAFLTAMDNLRAHKLRSSLTMLGMIFGVAAVIAMLAIGEGAERRALRMIARLGMHNVIVRSVEPPDEQRRDVRAKSLGISSRDADAIERAVPGTERVSPKLEIQPWTVLSDHGTSEASVYGVGTDHARLVNLRVAEGRFLDGVDQADHAQVCVIGSRARRDLFGYGPAVGEALKVNDVWLRVVGVLGGGVSAGGTVEGVAVGSSADQILLPVTTARRKFERDPLNAPLTEIIVGLEDGVSGTRTAGIVDELLDRLHAGADDYELIVPEALLAQSRRTQRLFNLVMGAIAGISLLVGGIGIMNIMLATVVERTREIGVRRAVGARQADIRYQFVVESFSISAAGGFAGIVVGVMIAKVVAVWAGWQTIVTPGTVLLATGVAVTVGLVSGIYPAHRAAGLDPIDALRHE